MEYYMILVFSVKMRFELDYNMNYIALGSLQTHSELVTTDTVTIYKIELNHFENLIRFR